MFQICFILLIYLFFIMIWTSICACMNQTIRRAFLVPNMALSFKFYIIYSHFSFLIRQRLSELFSRNLPFSNIKQMEVLHRICHSYFVHLSVYLSLNRVQHPRLLTDLQVLYLLTSYLLLYLLTSLRQNLNMKLKPEAYKNNISDLIYIQLASLLVCASPMAITSLCKFLSNEVRNFSFLGVSFLTFLARVLRHTNLHSV